MKKLLIVVGFLGLTLLGILFVTIGKFSKETPHTTTAVEHVSLYHYFSGSLSGGVDDSIKLINSNSKGIKIITHALDHEAFKTMILTTLDQGTPPELFTYWAGAKTQELVDNNHLQSIDEVWQQYNLDDLLSPALNISSTTYNGKKYFLPLDQHFVVVFYNKNIFNKLGLTPPKTYTELMQVAKKLFENNITPFSLGAVERWPAQFWFDYLLLRTAGPEYRQLLMEGKKTYIDKEVVEVYSIWSDLLRNNYFNKNANSLDWAEAAKLLCSGDSAMTLMGTWAIQLFTGDECNLEGQIDFDYFIFPESNPAIENTAVGPVDGIVISKNSINTQVAIKLLPFFFEKEVQQAFSIGSGAFTSSSSVPSTIYSPIKQRLLLDIKNADSWAFNYDLATPSEIADFGMDSFNELIEFPEKYREILQSLDIKTRQYFSKDQPY